MKKKLSGPTRALLITALAGSGCAGEDILRLDTDDQQVQLEHVDTYFEVSLAPFGATAPIELATGASITPFRNLDGTLKLAVDGTPLRGTCGVTFISPKSAITAAHCVDDSHIQDPSQHFVTIEMYSHSADLDWQSATNITGSWPSYTHPTMAAGYNVSSYDCRVVTRCGSSYGMYNCDPAYDSADVALLRCDGEPGNVHGYVNVAGLDDPAAPVITAWKHEIYDIPNNPNSDLHAHYDDYGDTAQNFHYFGAGRNQLLPLLSRPWPDIDRTKQQYTTDVVWTDLLGCHGTSGSGVFQLQMGSYELLGPVAVADLGLAASLCHSQADYAPGAQTLGYTKLAYTQYVVAGMDDCWGGPGEFSYLFWLKCHQKELINKYTFQIVPAPGPGGRLHDWLQNRVEPSIMIRSGTSLMLSNGPVETGVRYRVSAHVVPVDTTQSVILRVGATEIARATIARGTSRLLSGAFVSDRASLATITVEPAGSGTLAVNEIVLRRELATNDFDTMAARAGAGIVGSDGLVQPMRFGGRGPANYIAVLEPGERMVLAREALVPGVSHLIRFETTEPALLQCGMVFADGTEIWSACPSSTDSMAETGYAASAALTGSSPATPLAVLIDNQGSTRASIDNVQLQTSLPQ